MTQPHSHHDTINRQFNEQASNYLTSEVHRQGNDLKKLAILLEKETDKTLLDIGCGGGHVSYLACSKVKSVVAYDLSQEMLNTVNKEAKDKGYDNLVTQQGIAEKLPFSDNSFDIITTRYSLHHWYDTALAMREIYRVLKPKGRLYVIDTISPGTPELDIWLQTIEALRDPSHVCNYSISQLVNFISSSKFRINNIETFPLFLQFESWVKRMNTPNNLVNAIRDYQSLAFSEAQKYFDLQSDGSFTSYTVLIEAISNK